MLKKKKITLNAQNNVNDTFLPHGKEKSSLTLFCELKISIKKNYIF